MLSPTAGRAGVLGFDVATDPLAVRRRIGLAGQFAAVGAELTGPGGTLEPDPAVGPRPVSVFLVAVVAGLRITQLTLAARHVGEGEGVGAVDVEVLAHERRQASDVVVTDRIALDL